MPRGESTRHDTEPDAAGTSSDGGKVDREMLDKIFGDVLPDTTDDERDPGSGDRDSTEQWYRENRPPHHRD